MVCFISNNSGIFAYINFLKDKKLKSILTRLLDGLAKLEYRGYDSCGVCFDDIDKQLVVAKTKGNVNDLRKVLEEYLKVDNYYTNSIAIGHTRWATHGPPTANNAHPHSSSPNCEFVVVHNGIISNFAEIKNRLLQESMFTVNTEPIPDHPIISKQHEGDAQFTTETDTEVLAKLAYYVYKQMLEQNGEKPDFLSVIANTMAIVKGTYGAVFKSTLYPDECVACRLSSPMLIGLKYEGAGEFEHAARSIEMKRDGSYVSVSSKDGQEIVKAPRPVELFIASDAPAFAEKTKNVIILEDWDIVHISSKGVDIINTSPNSVSSTRLVEKLNISLQDIARGQYEHFMLKEIMEQPQSVMSTLRGRLIDEDQIVLGGIIPSIDTIKAAKNLIFIGCGTSYNAALAVRPLFEQFRRQRIFVEVASDFNDRKPVIFRDDVCVFLSQSGETADTLAALDYCRKAGAFTVGINNTPGSSISRNTHCGIHVNCGVEIGVASTKCYTSMILCLDMFLLLLMQDSIKLTPVRQEAVSAIRALPGVIGECLRLEQQMKELAEIVAKQNNLIMLGRKTHYATARETALKVKELTYIHSEGLMAGELKHGPLALIDDDSMVIFFATGEDDEMFAACQSSLQQIKARGAKILTVCNAQDVDRIKEASTWIVTVPSVPQWTQMIANIIPMQLLSYYTAVHKGINVDRPRNLAKSVTVQ